MEIMESDIDGEYLEDFTNLSDHSVPLLVVQETSPEN
jgi:hypothetical protein